MSSLRDGYDAVAEGYAARFLAELPDKPLDRALLDLIITEVDGIGPIADIGCGPGQVARYLYDHGAPALGVDLSPRMVEVAGKAHPGIGFHVGDMRSLHVPDQVWGGIVAFYSVIHVPPAVLPEVMAEFHRVLRPGGRVLVSFHLGDEVRHLDEWFDRPVSLDFHFFSRAVVEEALAGAGLVVSAYVERAPYEGEVETTRGYVVARRP